jgi:hypothetical protein
VDTYEPEERVVGWLRSLGLRGSQEYEDIFTQHQIDMVDIPSLTMPVLEQIGVTKVNINKNKIR